MKDTYTVYIYHDTITQMPLCTFESASAVEDYCRALYNQLRGMGAKGEIRIILQYRDERNYLQSKQVAFVSLYEPTFKYVETK